MAKWSKQLFIRLLCELIASLLVQFLGCSFGQGSSLAYAFAWGGLIIVGTMAFRIISGAHINPCISIASMILKNIKVLDGFLYMLMQLVGSAIGFLIAYVMFGSNTLFGANTNYCVTTVTVDPWWKALIIEFYLTGAWVLAFCSSWHESNQELNESVSLKIGLVVVGATLVGAQYSHTCMNPFRSLWPAIFSMNFDHIYIYVGMPIVAAILLPFAWLYIYLLGEEETAKGPGAEVKNEEE